MDMNLRNSKFFTPVMEKIFPFWGGFYTDDNYTYLLNAMFRYILIKKYGNNVITMKDEFKKIVVDNWNANSTWDISGYYEELVLNCNNPAFWLVYCTNDLIDTIELTDEFEELNSSTYPINSFIRSGSRKETRVFINKEKRQVIACLNGKITDRWIGRFLSCTSRIWQWIFNEQNTTEDDLVLLKSLSECDWEKVQEYFNKIAPDYSNEYLRAHLNVYQQSLINYQLDKCNYKVSDCQHDIESYERELRNCLDRLANINMQIQSLALLKNTQTDEVTPFFDCHKNITIRDIQQSGGDSTYILYTVNEVLEFYDVDEFKRIYENRQHNYLLTANDKLLNVLYAMFVEDKGHFLVQSEFRLNQLSSILPLRKDNITGVTYDDVLPQPHLGFFSCLGGNGIEIAKAMERGDWDLAIEQTIAATKNLAFGDHAVMNRLIGYLTEHTNSKFILADNGERMSINEFADYIGYKEADNG